MNKGYLRCCVHTHCGFCDGKDSAAAVAEQALAQGISVLGFSSHVHSTAPEDEGLTLPGDSGPYRAEILRLREAYAGRMEILCGLEWDSQSDQPHSGWDYWIGSVHHIPAGGRTYPVDWKPELLARCRDEACGGDMLTVAEVYFQEVARVAAEKPTILGHLDLICKLNGDGALFDEAHPRYLAAALAALEAVDPEATLLEINTGGMSRGYRSTPYPAPFLLKRWRERGGKIILTSDSHAKETLLFGLEEAAEAARRAGFTESVLLGRTGFQSISL